MEHNRTGLLCSVSRPTTHVHGRESADRPRAQRPAGPHAGSVTDDRQRRQTMTDVSVRNITGPLGRPVINYISCLTANYVPINRIYINSSCMLLQTDGSHG